MQSLLSAHGVALLYPAGLLKQAVTETQHAKVLIDGFPRVLDQLKDFEQSVGWQHNFHWVELCVLFVHVQPCDTVFYNVPHDAAKERLLKRGQSSPVYALQLPNVL